MASQLALVVKNLPAIAGDRRDIGSIPESGRSPGEGNGNPLQYSCLGNPMNRGGWWAVVHRVTQSWTGLKSDLAMINKSILYTIGRDYGEQKTAKDPVHALKEGQNMYTSSLLEKAMASHSSTLA